MTPNVMRLGLVSLLADISSEMLYPLIPIFITSVLHAPADVLGVIEGVAEATASLLKTVSGRLSDVWGRRRVFVFAGYAVSAVAKPVIGLATIWPTVLGARVADRFGKGIRTSPRDALIADSIAPEYRGKAFGWHRSMDTMGAVGGPLIALVLVWLTNNNLRLIFLLAVIPGLLSAGVVLTVRERKRPAKVPGPAPSSIRFSALPAPFRAYLIAWSLFAIANSSDMFLILKAKQVGYMETWTVALYALYNLIYAGASPVLGQLSDKIGRKRVLVGGLCVFAVVYVGFALARVPWMMWPLFAVYGLYVAATDGVGKAFAIDLVPSGIRGGAIGLLGTFTGIATLIASSVAGVLWTFVGPWAAFAYGAAGAVLGAVFLSRLASGRTEAG